MNLYKTSMDRKYVIDSVEIKGKEQRRLFDLGIVPGSKIKKVFKSIFNDPIAYEIKRTIIAIRNEDARLIEVRDQNE